jgi:hypothetical protein
MRPRARRTAATPGAAGTVTLGRLRFLQFTGDALAHKRRKYKTAAAPSHSQGGGVDTSALGAELSALAQGPEKARVPAPKRAAPTVKRCTLLYTPLLGRSHRGDLHAGENDFQAVWQGVVA